MSGNFDNNQLPEALFRGDDRAFEYLFTTYYRKVFSYAYRLTTVEWIADEIAQTVFYKLWLHRKSIFGDQNNGDRSNGGQSGSERKNITGYIFMMTKNEVVSYYRSRRQIQEMQKQFAVQICSETEATARLDYQECIKLVDRIVNSMPRQRRTIFVMSRYKSIPNKEIAQLLNLSKRTVEKHINLALSTLRQELATVLV